MFNIAARPARPARPLLSPGATSSHVLIKLL